MKLKLWFVMFVGLVAGSLAAFAQNTPTAGADSGTASSVTTTPEPAQPGTAVADAPAAEKPAAPASPPANAEAAQAQPAPATAPAAADVAQAQPASVAAAADSSAPAAGAAATPQPNAIIPLIVMDDVPLTDAIKNLARQAGLNYMLDPKVVFGQIGPDGKAAPQPNVSIRWENVSAEQALNALLGNYSLQLSEDPKSKIARITVKDPAAPEPLITKVIQLKFASPTNIVGAIQNTLSPRSKVVPDVRTSQLVVLATEKEMVEVEHLIDRLDTITKQVLIETRMLETQINPRTQKGIDWSPTLANQHVIIGNNALPGTPPTPASTIATANGPVTTPADPGTIGGIVNPPAIIASLAKGSFFQPSMAFLNADGVSAVISFLNTYAETKVISSPRTVTLDNEPSVIEVGTMFPIVNTTAGTANTTGGSQVTYSNLTVRLEVTPRISANNYVHLKVIPTIMRLGDLVNSVVGSQNNAVYSFQKREIHTSVMIPSGNTLVMGGLIEDNVHTENIKVPLLGDLPYVGLLFRHDSKNRNKSNLMVFLTPTIVQDEDFQPTKSDYLKTPVPTKDSVEEDWSSWDSGKPKDWSQTSPTDETKFAALPAVNNNNNLTTVPADDQSGQPAAAVPAAPEAKAAPEVQAAVAAQPSKFSDIPGGAKE